MTDLIQQIQNVFTLDLIVFQLIGGILVSLCASLLGVSLVLKRCSMIGDGLSHVGFGALSIAVVMSVSPLKVAIPVVIIAAIILLRLSESSRINGDSAIALFATSSLAIAVFATSRAKKINDVSNYMFGSILAMNRHEVKIIVILSIVVILTYIIFYNKIFAVTFDGVFSSATGINVNLYNMLIAVLTALTVVFGMLMMGALLISSLIIFPSLTAMRICKSFKGVIITSSIMAVFCFIIGFIVSIIWNASPGASVVIVNLIMFILFSIYSKIKSKQKIFIRF
ncbi:MAG: metal ABC transporter permease [Clostridiales bacterium]|nr:metal ABC transporter permease [Clostridiales bacterium]